MRVASGQDNACRGVGPAKCICRRIARGGDGPPERPSSTVHVGCSGWIYAQWRGLFYPAELEVDEVGRSRAGNSRARAPEPPPGPASTSLRRAVIWPMASAGQGAAGGRLTTSVSAASPAIAPASAFLAKRGRWYSGRNHRTLPARSSSRRRSCDHSQRGYDPVPQSPTQNRRTPLGDLGNPGRGTCPRGEAVHGGDPRVMTS